MVETPSIVVAAAIIQRGGKFLLTKRRPDVHLGGLWEFPGGKQERGETLEMCLRRELREELAIEISEPTPFLSLCHSYPEKEVELHFFSCSIVKGNPQALESSEIAWVSRGELERYEMPNADRAVLKKINQTDANPIQSIR